MSIDGADPWAYFSQTATYAAIFLAAVAWCLFSRREVVPQINVQSHQVPKQPRGSPDRNLPCYDPATKELLGYVPAMNGAEVRSKIAAAERAAKIWRQSSFKQRRLVLKILLQYITENQEDICRVASRDSGKAMLDAAFGELTVSCEKLCWLIKEGERWLRPEYRTSSRMMFYKSARVEYSPIGVIGAIVPWNYPFHNIINPLTSAIFAGNAVIIKASEHASWSALYYLEAIRAALAAAGAPTELVQIVTGLSEAGAALVAGGVGKLIFVGSTAVGKRVMAAAAENLTPVVLELGGKDPIIICSDADLDHAVEVTLRGTFQSSGQNCAGCERVLVHASVYDECVSKLVERTRALRQGAPLEGDPRNIDVGALALPGLAQNIDSLVQEAVSQGAKVLVGGRIAHPGGAKGDFYAPTVITEVTSSMRIWKEEVFGPVMAIRSFQSDQEAAELANDCAFGLGSNVFSRSTMRANGIIQHLQAGMANINDFATSYMNQSLPFGGVKDSGFDRFAGVEGLRGNCHVKAVCQDRWPWLMRTDIPPMLKYPTKPAAFDFQTGLIRMFYAPSWASKLKGLSTVLRALAGTSSSAGAPPQRTDA